MGSFLLFVGQSLLTVLIWAIIINAVLSWLVAFNVINPHNRLAYTVLRMLDGVTGWALAPFRRVIPALGGVDITPIIAIIILMGLRDMLLPWLFALLPPALG